MMLKLETNSTAPDETELDQAGIAVAATDSASPELEHSDRMSRGVLVVDDDQATLDEVVDVLRGDNIRSAGIRSGQEAFEFLRSEPDIDVVVTDVFMPRLGGIGFVQGIADRLPERPWIRTLLVSGRPSPEVVRDAMRTPAVEFLPKPIAPAVLIDATKRALDIAARARLRFCARDYDAAMTGGGLSSEVSDPCTPRPEMPLPTFKADLLERIARMRALEIARAKVSGEHLAMLPAWDMLLDLLRAYVEGRKVSVSALCLATPAPATTALRRIDDLAEARLIERCPDPSDGRRVFVRLSDEGMRKVSLFLSSFRIDPIAAPRHQGDAHE